MKYTHKTEDGNKARIVCDDVKSEYGIVVAVLQKDEAEYIYAVRRAKDGNFVGPFIALKEISPWDDVAVDTPVWVRDSTTSGWCARHFAKYEHGTVFCWRDGLTSHSTDKGSLLKFRSWECATLENPNGN